MSYLNPQEALDYGVIDRILTSQKISQIKFNTHKTILNHANRNSKRALQTAGSQYERWVDIYTRLGVERILSWSRSK